MPTMEVVAFTVSYEESYCVLYARSDNYLYQLEYAFPESQSPNTLLSSFHEQYRMLADAATARKAVPSGQILSILEKLIAPFQQSLKPTGERQSLRLYDYLYPKQIDMVAEFDNGSIQIKEADDLPVYLPPGELLRSVNSRTPELWDCQPAIVPSTRLNFPRLSATRFDPRFHGPELLYMDDGSQVYFKGFRPHEGRSRQATNIELRRHCQIESAIQCGRLPNNLRIARLYGLLIDDYRDIPAAYQAWDADGRLIALLLSYITPRMSNGCSSLLDMDNEYLAMHQSRFIRDINDALCALHEAGIVWGDAKPANVLVSKDNEVWLIDFGGSFTPGWVDEDKMNTMEGDIQGFKRMESWIMNRAAEATNQQ